MSRSRVHTPGCILAGAALCTLAASAASASVFESFEGFTGTSGSTINGYSNSGATWTGNSTYSIVLTDQADAYDGDNYFRINDQDGAGQVHQTLTLDTPMELVGGVGLSYSLRWSSLPDLNPWLIFNPRVTDGESSPLLGNQWNEYTHDFDSLDQDTWYLFDQEITIDESDPTNPVFNIALTITNTETDDVVLDDDTYFTWTVDEGFTSLAGFRMFTGGSAAGVIDIDAVSIVPEPGSLALLGLGVLAIAGRRRRG